MFSLHFPKKKKFHEIYFHEIVLFQVSLYSLKTGKYVTDLLQTEVVEAIWSNNPDDDFFFALASTENNLTSMKVRVPNGKVSRKNTHKIDFHSDSLFQIQVIC